MPARRRAGCQNGTHARCCRWRALSCNGPDFVSRALLRWAAANQLETALIDPGKPWRNGVNERINGKFRDECLGMEWFRNRVEVKAVIDKLASELQRGTAAFPPGQPDPVEFARGLP